MKNGVFSIQNYLYSNIRVAISTLLQNSLIENKQKRDILTQFVDLSIQLIHKILASTE